MSDTSKSKPSSQSFPQDPYAPVPVDLKNAPLAALLAWLWPGAGHIYQQRYGKGILFMACILLTYFFGLTIGDGHVVYASFKKPDVRYPYLLQVGVGIPALPALFVSREPDNWNPNQSADEEGGWFDRFMAPPRNYDEQLYDEMASWHERTGYFFELGTLFTMIAGLLNVLAIYDAYAGPVFMHPNPKKQLAAMQEQASIEKA